MNILMISGDNSIAEGKKGTFYHMLKEFSKYWDRIDVICPRLHISKITCTSLFNNVFIHSSSLPKILQPLYILKKGQELHSENTCRLIVCHEFGLHYNSLGSYLLWKKTGISYLSEIHGLIGYPKAINTGDRIRRFIAESYIRFIKDKVAGFRVVNEAELKGKLINLGVSNERINVLYSLYIDFDIFKPKNLRRIYDITFIGRLDDNKGIFLILDAIFIVKKIIPDIKLLVVGNGKEKNKFFKKAKKLNLLENISHIAWVPYGKEIADLYCKSKIVVCASYSEGGPRFTVEAMACECAIITSPVGVMKEIIKDGENGFLFYWDKNELSEKIILLLKDNDKLRAIGKEGSKCIEKFSYKEIIKQLAFRYREIAS